GLTLDMANIMAAPTQNTLNYDDSNLRQGKTLDLKNNFKKNPGSFGVNYTLGVDLNLYGFDFHPTRSAGDSLTCSLPLTSDTCAHTTNIPIVSFTILDVVIAYANVDISAAITTTANLNGDGASSLRSMTTQSIPIVDDQTLNFTSSPQVKDETTFLSCSLPAGDQIHYAMGDESSHVGGTVTEGVGIGVGVSVWGRDPIPFAPDFHLFDVGPFDFHLFDLPSVTMNPITLSAPAQAADLGVLQKNNIPP